MTERWIPIAALASAGGLILALRFGWQAIRNLSRKFRRGVPYLWGSAPRAFLLFLASLGLLGAGLLLGAAGYELRRFQPVGEMSLVGTLEVRREGSGLAFSFRPAADYPAPLVPAAVTPGGRWSVAGEFIRWSRPLRWLGLRDSHRLAWFLAVSDPADIPRPEKITRRRLGSGPEGLLWRGLRDWERFLRRAAETREFQTPWETGKAAAIELYAFPGGYLFVHPGEPN